MIWSFLHGPRRNQVELIEAVPAQCATLLSQEKVEAALVPVIEYQRTPNFLVVPDVCVGATREVRSVVLVSKRDDLREVLSVALDESSRTSATLVKIIFRQFIGHEPQWTSNFPNVTQMLSKSDAALIIGDPAMTFPREGLNVWDLAGLWRQFTGLGFVFAMWMVRENLTALQIDIDFAAVRDEGLAATDEIISNYEHLIPLSSVEIRKYLTENVCFRIEPGMKDGLQVYFQLAHKHGLIADITPLRFV